MKKRIAYILALVLCLLAVMGGIFAYSRFKTEDAPTQVVQQEEEELSSEDAMKKAVEYLRTIYKDAEKETPRDYERIGVVPVGKLKFQVTWSVDVSEDYIKIIVGEDGMVTIDINEECGEEIPYVLTATIIDAEGNTKTLTWEHVIPKKIVGTYQEIVDMAYALKPGESLESEATLKGIIAKINTEWSDTYQNITVTILVEGRETKPIVCYRLEGEGAKDLALGDTIEVTGILTNYNGTIEFAAGCILESVEKGDGTAPELPTIKGTMQEIVDKAYALGENEVLEGGEAILTGSVIKVNTPYSEQYKNVTVTIVVDGREDKPIQCYRMKGTNADKVAVGDLITVRGTLKKYYNTVEFDAGCELQEWVKGGATYVEEAVKPIAPIELSGELGTGDKVVIYAPAYGRALSANKAKNYDGTTGYYNAGVVVTVADGVMSGYGDSEVFTVTKNIDGTYSFANGNKNLGMAASHSNMDLGAENDKWELIDLGKGLYNIKNVGRGNYMEWYDSYSNWSTYGSSSAATDDQFQLSFYIVSKGAASTKTYTLEEAKAALEELYADVEEATTKDYERIGTFTLGASKFTVTWSVDVGDDVAKVVENSDGSYTIDVNEKPAQDTEYVLTATIANEKNETIKTTWNHLVTKSSVVGNVVIWAPAYNKALSTEKTGYYNVGVDVTLAGDVLYGYSDSEVWQMVDNGDGTYSFINGGQKLSMAAANSSMTMDEINDKWELVELGNDLYNIKNTGRGNYMEWYNSYSNWSTYNSSYAATDDQFQLAIYMLPEEEQPVTLADAVAYLQSKYVDNNVATPDTYTREGSVVLGDVTFPVVWSVEVEEAYAEVVKVTEAEGTYTVEITASEAADVPYKLVATITDSEDATETETVTWDYTVEQAVSAPETPQEILEAAYALGTGETLEEPNPATLTGLITSVDTAYSSQYGNVTVTIAVKDCESMPIKCYRLKGEGADVIKAGDVITVTGTITNYRGGVQFAAGCELVAYATAEELAIVDAAYELESGASMSEAATLTGTIVEINTPYSDYYENITVTMTVLGREDKPIMCYRLKGEGAADLAVGDVITVKGTIKNYGGTIEFVAGCTLVTNEEFVMPETPEEIVDLAFTLESGESFPEEATLVGVISSVDTAYSAQYGNVTVTITVDGTEGEKSIQCFRLKGEGADAIGVGDAIKVTGVLSNYNGTIQFGNGSTLDAYTAAEDLAIVDAAYELESGASMSEASTLTGTIVEINTPYSDYYENITVTMTVLGREDKPIMCYRLKGEGAADLAVGDVITVTGTIKNYGGTIEFNSGCTFVPES